MTLPPRTPTPCSVKIDPGQRDEDPDADEHDPPHDAASFPGRWPGPFPAVTPGTARPRSKFKRLAVTAVTARRSAGAPSCRSGGADLRRCSRLSIQAQESAWCRDDDLLAARQELRTERPDGSAPAQRRILPGPLAGRLDPDDPVSASLRSGGRLDPGGAPRPGNFRVTPGYCASTRSHAQIGAINNLLTQVSLAPADRLKGPKQLEFYCRNYRLLGGHGLATGFPVRMP